MRLAAQVVGGYYKCAPEVVRLIAGLIQYQGGAVLDPCAGEGEALEVLGQGVGCPREKLYAIELERDRSAKVRERLPDSPLLGPCSCFETRISAGSFSIVYVNPPFDHNVKGGRAEIDFLARSTELLAPAGILVLIVPQHLVNSYYLELPRFLWPCYEQLAVLTFPEEHRPFKEVVVIGKKRRKRVDLLPTAEDWNSENIPVGPLDQCALRWQAPALGYIPKLFEKAGLTDVELIDAVETSPLWKLTRTPEIPQPARPPLPLARGHVALLLASGQLNGVVYPAGEPSHVVRGTAHKVGCTPEVSTEETPSGGIKTITILKERIQLVVRAVGPDGSIKTFQ